MEQTTNAAWRLPTIDEIKTIVVNDQKPAINGKVFPECPLAPFWSGSPRAGYSYDAWGVYFGNGYADGYNRSYGFRVRLVRGGQGFDPSWSALDTEGRWYNCGDGLAFDRETGLQWQRYCVGQSWNSSKPVGEPELLSWAEVNRLTTDELGGEDEDSKIILYLEQRIQSGTLTLEDIPQLMVRYGAMSPKAFYEEMHERIALEESEGA